MKSSFRKLVEICDNQAREELDDIYIIKASNMNNLLQCLDSNATQITDLFSKLKEAEAKIESLENMLYEMNVTLNH